MELNKDIIRKLGPQRSFGRAGTAGLDAGGASAVGQQMTASSPSPDAPTTPVAAQQDTAAAGAKRTSAVALGACVEASSSRKSRRVSTRGGVGASEASPSHGHATRSARAAAAKPAPQPQQEAVKNIKPALRAGGVQGDAPYLTLPKKSGEWSGEHFASPVAPS